jgi:hypothetical protein
VWHLSRHASNATQQRTHVLAVAFSFSLALSFLQSRHRRQHCLTYFNIVLVQPISHRAFWLHSRNKRRIESGLWRGHIETRLCRSDCTDNSSLEAFQPSVRCSCITTHHDAVAPYLTVKESTTRQSRVLLLTLFSEISQTLIIGNITRFTACHGGPSSATQPRR